MTTSKGKRVQRTGLTDDAFLLAQAVRVAADLRALVGTLANNHTTEAHEAVAAAAKALARLNRALEIVARRGLS